MLYTFHIGCHKAASSLIQKTLEQNRRPLAKQGVFVVNNMMPEIVKERRQYYRRISRRGEKATLALQRVSKTFEKVVAAARDRGCSLIIDSNENYLGTPAYTQIRYAPTEIASFYPQRNLLLAALTGGADRVDGVEVRALVVKRDLSTMLPSLYGEGLRNLAFDYTFAQFIEAIDLSSYDYGSLIADVSRIFDSVVPVEFEALATAGTAPWLHDVLSVMGVPDPSKLTMPTSRVRRGLDAEGLEKLRVIISKLFAEDVLLEEAKRARDDLFTTNTRGEKLRFNTK